MAMFDPKKHKSDPDKKGDSSYLEVAGEFLLVARRFNRGKSNSGKPYLGFMFYVIYGPLKDKKFRQRIYLNEESLWKLGRWCESMQYEDPFDINDNKSVYDALCNSPFKAKIKVKSGDKKREDGTTPKFAEIEAFYTRYSDEETEFINRWLAEWEVAREQQAANGGYGGGGGGGDPAGGFGDDPGPAGYGGGGGSDDFADDDIPF